MPASDADAYLRPLPSGLPPPEHPDSTASSSSRATIEAASWLRESREGNTAILTPSWGLAADFGTDITQIGSLSSGRQGVDGEQRSKPAKSSLRNVFRDMRGLDVLKASQSSCDAGSAATAVQVAAA